MAAEWLLYFDGDDVGAHIELLVIEGRLDEAASLSSSVVRAIGKLADELRRRTDARILFSAGDEVLAATRSMPPVDLVDELRHTFAADAGLTVSCGIGRSGAEAASNLRYAKLLGKNRLYPVAISS